MSVPAHLNTVKVSEIHPIQDPRGLSGNEATFFPLCLGSFLLPCVDLGKSFPIFMLECCCCLCYTLKFNQC